MELKILNDLNQNILTKEDLISFLEQIEIAKSFVFKETNKSFSKRIKGKVEAGFWEYIQELEKNGLFPNSASQQIIFFDEIADYFQQLPQLSLKLAFTPSQKFLFEIKEWFKRETNQEIILDLIVNPFLIGGAIIEYKGHYRDFSLGEEINKAVLKVFQRKVA